MTNKLILLLFLAIKAAQLKQAVSQTSSSSNSDQQCYAYIQGDETATNTFSLQEGPYAIECGESEYGDNWGPEQYQDNSCCDGDGRYLVVSGQVGGFRASYRGISDVSISSPKCWAYIDALQAVLCDPKQGEFISETDNQGATLIICKSDCDEAFTACGNPGENLPSSASYTDGTSLCQEMWGGFGYDNPCDSHPNGFPCQATLSISIMDDEQYGDNECLKIIRPSQETIDHYDWFGEAPSKCDDVSTEAAVGAVIILVLMCCCCCACCGGCAYCVYRGYNNKNGSNNNNTNINPFVGGTSQPPEQQPVTVVGAPPSAVPGQPVANTYNYNQTDINTDTSPPLAVATPESQTSISPSAASAPKSSFEYDQDSPPMVTATVIPNRSLADHLEQQTSTNVVTAIQEWIRDNPEATSVMMPQEVATALPKVTFSLEQTEAAEAIAKGIKHAGGKVTCRHIVAAMQKCSSGQSADIAKAMAPYVADPQNKSIVLDEISLSFQKDEVEKCFSTAS